MPNVQTVFQRHEKKYMLDARQADGLLRFVRRHIRPDEYGRYTNCSVYYDTDDFRALNAPGQQHYKEKLRLRSYGVPGRGDTVFLELKKKLEGVTYKRRVPLPLGEAEAYLCHGIKPAENGQVMREVDWFKRHHAPNPKLVLCYDRLAFSGIEDESLRLTFDENVRWRDTSMSLTKGDWGSGLLPPGKVLLEVKVAGAIPLWLAHALGYVGAYPTSFSKYRTAATAKLNKEERAHAG